MEPKDYEELQQLQRRYEEGEEIDEDRLYELELLNRHSMGESLTKDEQEDLAAILEARGHEHDQLPSVEEYKAQMGYKSKKGLPYVLEKLRPTKKDPIEFKLDPDGDYFHVQENVEEEVIDFAQETDGIFSGPAQMTTFIVDEEFLQEQARNSEQQNTPKIAVSNSCPYFKALALVIVPIVIAVIIIIARIPEENAKRYHWMHGETDNYLAIKDFVTGQRSISHADAFDSTDSPQYLAAQWMAHGDTMKLPVPNSPNLTFEDRYVVTVLYFALDGPQWENQVGFLGDGHICTWFETFTIVRGAQQEEVVYGLHGCEGDDPTDPDSFYPRTLSLPSNGLVGTIPHEVQSLDRLMIFNLEYNGGVTGTLPPALWKMTSLQQLILQWCDLKGTIPTWIGEMENLTYLGLGNNQFEGLVPSEISKLTQLQLLGLDNNNLDGTFDVFAALTNLRSLYLDHNYLSGSLTDDLMAGWPNLQELDLSDTLLMGPLPSTFFSASNDLRVVDLHANQVQGPIPPVTEPNAKLEFLALHENSMSGIIPDTLTNLKAIRHLDLSTNSFTSTIPEKIEELTNLQYLHVGLNNFIKGTMPKFLIELTNLRELGLKDCRLTGTIPEYIQYLSKLQFLDLHDNSLTGTIPTGISKLTALRHLILKQNELRGTLPQEFSKLTDLELLLLEQNNFEGDAEVICNSNDILVDTFVADCYTDFPRGAGSNKSSNFTCSCCSTCCSKDDPNCNGWEWKGNLDPSWEYGFRRERYSYNLGPVIWTP